MNEYVIKLDKYMENMKFSPIELSGLLSYLIIDKSILKSNHEVSSFVYHILELKFPTYVVKSRTLMAAKVSRIIFEDENLDIVDCGKKIQKTLKSMEIAEESKPKNNKSTSNENIKMMKWLDGLK